MSRRSTMSMDNFHDDLLAQILVRQPVKSIVRFKSVSKAWCSMLENPVFVSEYDVNYLNNKKNKKNKKKKSSHLLIIQSNLLIIQSHDEKHLFCDFIRMCLFDDQTLTSYQDLIPQLPPSIEARPYNLGVIIHDGLLCLLHNSYRDITLWNPVTREFRLVPKICHEKIRPTTELWNEFSGFGSDSSSTEYKVVRCYFYYDSVTKKRASLETLRHYFVYRVSTNSWRELRGTSVEAANAIEYISYVSRSNGCVNGVHYWVGNKRDGGDFSILAFHLSIEVFESIDFPTSGRQASGVLLRLPDIEDRLCLWIPPNSTNDIIGDVWLLNKDDDNKGQYFWTKLLRINDHFPQIGRMLRFWNNNEVFVRIRNAKSVLLCNLETDKLGEVEIKIDKYWHLSGIYTYEESLCPIAYRNF
ncbi:hypothetical protein COLO4_23482 [Corchorus olitorius]|uniref:Uncharacterized protein n=1 Tax=Corchorus olitorius TaxID=93759 RepID=A0A1R3IG81_9ROSI|nr:hypothetical protein COLO4_23482 [Corchorus olitorius]